MLACGVLAFAFTACATFGAPGPVAAFGAPATEYRTFGETLVRFGVGARTELRLFGNSYATRLTDGSPSVHGVEDAKVGVKVNLRAVPDSVHAWLPSTALLAATTVATGARGIGAGAAQPETKLAVSWTTPSPFSLYADLRYGRSLSTRPSSRPRSWQRDVT